MSLPLGLLMGERAEREKVERGRGGREKVERERVLTNFALPPAELSVRSHDSERRPLLISMS